MLASFCFPKPPPNCQIVNHQFKKTHQNEKTGWFPHRLPGRFCFSLADGLVHGYNIHWLHDGNCTTSWRKELPPRIHQLNRVGVRGLAKPVDKYVYIYIYTTQCNIVYLYIFKSIYIMVVCIVYVQDITCVYLYNIHFFDPKIYKWRMFLHAVFRSHVKLSKESLMSNFPSNNLRLPSTGMDTQHLYQFNARFYQNPSRDYTYSIFLLLKSQTHQSATHECHQFEEMEKPWHSCYALGWPIGCFFVSENCCPLTAHGLMITTQLVQKAMVIPDSSLTQCFLLINTMNTSKWVPAASDFSNLDSNQIRHTDLW